jgi:chromosomal replication initiator protein
MLSGLNPRYTFDNFVVGKNNQFVYAAARAVTESPGGSYNPLFIYGGVGLGKTHILQAIGNYIIASRPELRVAYVTCDRFINEFITCIRLGKDKDSNAHNFRSRYRSVDVLMIDDIEFLRGKTGTQEEFFHTFNDLHSQGKQIILSSDRPPREINPLEERLRSRFGGGLVADIQLPDFETRVAILQKKAALLGYSVPDNVVEYIAELNGDNVRVMEENLTRAYFFARLQESPLSVELAAEALKDVVRDADESLSIDVIIDVICAYYKVQRDDLLGKKKNKEIVYPRQMCIYLITEIIPMPLASIGALMGGRDHTTVMYARDKIAQELKNNPAIKLALQEIRNLIYKK